MANVMSFPTRIVHGRGAIRELPQELERVSAHDVLVVTDKGILRLDAPPVKGTLVGPSVNGRGATPSGLLSWYFRRRGLEY